METLRSGAAIFALAFIGLSIAAHAASAPWIDDFAGNAAYFSLAVAIAISVIQARRKN